MAFNYRLPPPLEASFIEEEVFNTEIGGHNDEELAQDEGNDSSVKRINVEDHAIHQEKCVVFTDAIMSLLMGAFVSNRDVVVCWNIEKVMLVHV
jgi:hypothetical protein